MGDFLLGVSNELLVHWLCGRTPHKHTSEMKKKINVKCFLGLQIYFLCHFIAILYGSYIPLCVFLYMHIDAVHHELLSNVILKSIVV